MSNITHHQAHDALIVISSPAVFILNYLIQKFQYEFDELHCARLEASLHEHQALIETFLVNTHKK